MRVHKNLHKGCWTTKENSAAKVAHADEVLLSGCAFHVSESARAKVLENKCRSVHAHVSGREQWLADAPQGQWRAISYNPYKAGHFYYCDNGERVYGAFYVHFRKDGSAWAI